MVPVFYDICMHVVNTDIFVSLNCHAHLIGAGWWLHGCVCSNASFLCLHTNTTVKHKACDRPDKILLSRSRRAVNLPLMKTDCVAHQPISMIIKGMLVLFGGSSYIWTISLCSSPATVSCHLRKPNTVESITTRKVPVIISTFTVSWSLKDPLSLFWEVVCHQYALQLP